MKIRAAVFVAIVLVACSDNMPTSTDPLTTASVSTLAGSSGSADTTTHPDTGTKPDTTTHPDTGTRPDTTTHPDTGTRPDTTTHPDTGTRPDTTTHPDTATRPDTTGPVYTGVVHLAGHVLGHLPGSDSLHATPIAGAVLKLYRNVLVNGSGVSVYVGEVVSGADGSYQFSNLPAGYYLLRTHVASAPWAGDYLSYVAANAAEVTIDLRIWPHN